MGVEGELLFGVFNCLLCASRPVDIVQVPCVAVCCGVLRCIVCCEGCSVLQCVVVCCIVLQRVAVWGLCRCLACLVVDCMRREDIIFGLFCRI